jgi:pre-rRNA-processing protein TSR1
MHGLLKYENKMSVMNLKLRRVNLDKYSLPIKSKDSLVFHVGCRRFEAGAIYSQHTSSDKHKVVLFL